MAGRRNVVDGRRGQRRAAPRARRPANDAAQQVHCQAAGESADDGQQTAAAGPESAKAWSASLGLARCRRTARRRTAPMPGRTVGLQGYRPKRPGAEAVARGRSASVSQRGRSARIHAALASITAPERRAAGDERGADPEGLHEGAGDHARGRRHDLADDGVHADDAPAHYLRRLRLDAGDDERQRQAAAMPTPHSSATATAGERAPPSAASSTRRGRSRRGSSARGGCDGRAPARPARRRSATARACRGSSRARARSGPPAPWRAGSSTVIGPIAR